MSARTWAHRLRRAVATATVACAGAAAVTALTAPPAAGAPVDDFYLPPAQLAEARGSILKSEPLPVLALPPTDGGTWPVSAERVMFTSRTQDDVPVAVTGVYVDSSAPWTGPGERPTVIIAPGTVGQGDKCAPSVAFANGVHVDVDPGIPSISVNQEAVSTALWTARGARVFVTDYIGLGTPGIHTYVNRRESAHAVLDAARAANTLSGTGPETPLLFWGYSQGGGATAAAAELQPSYAPELDLRGVWAGGPVADLTAVLAQVDGSLIGGAIGFTLNGLADRYPVLERRMAEVLTTEGRATLKALESECIGDVIFSRPFLRTDTLTVDGRSLLDWLSEIPEAKPVLDEQRIGRLTPTAPVIITSGINDDSVPYGQARQLAEDWCAGGASVTFRTNHLPPIAPGTTLPNHFGPQIIDGYVDDTVMRHLVDQLGDRPAQGCSFD
ncbi:lipase [Rhodococcus triatomae]|uniref:Secretory lipase n=1 Tax=Rhodococcus triatomae TaxID=300028 RepID=A0A1G8GR03_9NOCA|nr:lipase family protein [Rhodococcus triatomae]QNG20319.1 lipase [Rhodococcus triatomae]QNG23765.1 lipase [Rhodococcus triatomae]SDH96812.1 Secretory lipase [Rhodococcus triatomae]